MDNLVFQPIFSSTLMLVIAAIAVLMMSIGPSFANIAFRQRMTLSLLRLGVIGLAFLALLRPGCVELTEQNQAAVLIVAMDVSRSMDLPHILDNSTRWNSVKELIATNQDRFDQLAGKKIEVKFYQFDSELTSLEVEGGVVQLPKDPTGSETDIGTSILEATLGVRDRRLLAMVLLSDGVQNVLDPEIEMTDAVNALNDIEAPLIAVPFGTAGDSGQLADVAITSFAEQMVVNKNSDLNAQATLVARGYANQDIKVDLVISDGKNEQIVASELVRPNEAYEELNVRLKYRPTEPGEYRISVRAVPLPGEVAVRNNSLDGFLTVRDKGMRVLLLAGSLGWEQRALRDSLPALDFVDMQFRPLFTPPVEIRNRKWPIRDLAEEFSDDTRYDVYILCNVDSRALWNKREKSGPLADLAEAVRGGKGLLMLGGTHSFGPGGYADTPLADLLPVEMKSSETQPFEADILKELHINRPIQLVPSRDHFLTRISDTESTKDAWRNLPPLVGANRLVPKKSATVSVFLQSDDEARHPILISTNVGGRVLAFAGDSTWRWRMSDHRKQFDQFWRQLVLYLAFWDSKNDQNLTIDLTKRRFTPNSRIRFGVNVRTATGDFVDGVNFKAILQLPDGTQEQIAIVPNGTDGYRCELNRDLVGNSGLHRIVIEAAKDGNFAGRGEREFVILDRDKEKANPAANPQQLVRLASQTAEFGGTAIQPEQLSGLLDEYIANPPIKKIEIPTSWRLGEKMLDASLFLGAFVLLLAVEWGLRKKWGLV